MSERTGDITSLEYLRNWVGQEYKPCDSLFGIDKIWNWISDGVTGLKENESSGELDSLRYSMKRRSAGGNLLSKILPTFENCLIKMLGISEEKIMIMMITIVLPPNNNLFIYVNCARDENDRPSEHTI